MFVGIDPTSFDKKGTACALLDENGHFVEMVSRHTNDDIIDFVTQTNPRIVAIDSPLGFPKGMDCLEQSHDCESVHDFKGRACEREIMKRGIRLYVTSKKTFIKPMIYRSIAMAEEFRKQGREVIEVYPHGSKVCLFGTPIPKKTRKAGRDFLRDKLIPLIPGLERYQGRYTHDLLDALVAAHTAYLYANNGTETVGPPDEVPIVLPKVS